MKEGVIQSALSLALSFPIAFLFIVMDGHSIPSLAPSGKFSIHSLEMVKDHEIFMPNHVGKYKPKIIMSSSCMIWALHCTMEDESHECTVPGMLEQEFYRNNYSNVRIANVGLPEWVAGHNLNVFFQILEDPNSSVYIWHNDFRANDSIFKLKKEAVMTYLPFIYSALKRLRMKHPDIEEIDYLYREIKQRYPSLNAEEIPTYLESNRLAMNQAGISTFIQGTTHNIKLALHYIKDFQIHPLLTYLKKNTNYFRMLRADLENSMGITTPIESFHPYIEKLRSSNVKYIRYEYYEKAKLFKGIKYNEKQYGQALTLRIIGKLAALYNKKVYLLFDPAGRCQKNGSYDEEYKKPLISAVKDLSSVTVLDLTDIEMEKGIDTQNCINYLYPGKLKIVKRLFKDIHDKEQFRR